MEGERNGRSGEGEEGREEGIECRKGRDIGGRVTGESSRRKEERTRREAEQRWSNEGGGWILRQQLEMHT